MREAITLDLTALPDDPALLKSLVVDLVAVLQQERVEKEQLRHRLMQALRHRFGRRAETMDPGQLELFARQIEAALAKTSEPPPETETTTSAPPKGHGRRKPRKDLPKVRKEYPLPEELQICKDCSGKLEKIDEEVTTQLDWVPASMLVREHVRFTYACKACEGNVVTSEMPGQPIDKGLPGAGLLAQIVTSKYADHLPLYRQEAIFGRQGVDIARSTMCDWVGRVAELLSPVYEAMKAEVLQSKVLHTDDTPVPVLDEGGDRNRQGEAAADEGPSRRKTREARLWVYVGDETHPHTVFDYTPNRKKEGPQEFLGDWRGYLQADAYGGYDTMFKLETVWEVACWAHARRKFYDCQGTDPTRAKTALAYIQRLYAVEREATDRELSPPDRKVLRQERSRPILDAFKAWLDAQGPAVGVVPKSPLGEAVGYALRQWEALTRYLEDGDLDIDNNEAERALRCVAIGRKNWLFAGSDAGGDRAAVIYSLISSCKRHQLDPFVYLRDVIERVSTTPQSEIRKLLPAEWSPAPRPEPAPPA